MPEGDVNELSLWLLSVGCPTNLIPNEKKIKEITKAEILSIDELRDQFRTCDEALSVQERYLRIQLCKIKKRNFLIVDRKSVPGQYQQYLKVNSLKKGIEKTEETVEEIKLKIREQRKQLWEKNLVKKQKKDSIEKNLLQVEFLKENQSILKKKILEANKSLAVCDSAWFCRPETGKESKIITEQLLIILDSYYRNSAELGSIPENELKEKMLESFTEKIRDTPNSVICRDLLRVLGELLELTQNLVEKNQQVPNQEKDRYYKYHIGLRQFMAERLKLLLIRQHFRKKLQTLTDVYVEKFNSFREILSNKWTHWDPDFILEYIQLMLVNASHAGQIASLEAEAEKYQVIPQNGESSDENCEKIKKDLHELYDDFTAEAKKIETSILQLKNAPDKLEFTLKMLHSCLNEMKIFVKQDKQNESVWMSPLMERTSSRSFKLVKQERVEEDTTETWMEPQKCIFPPPLDLDFKVPVTENHCNELKKRVIKMENSLKSLAAETKLVGKVTADELTKAESYFSFLMENPLKKFVPTTKKFNGHTYQEYETEFDIHYRQIYGNK